VLVDVAGFRVGISGTGPPRREYANAVWKGDVFGQLGFAEPAQLSQIVGWVLDAELRAAVGALVKDVPRSAV
jgi:hypothetical protein